MSTQSLIFINSLFLYTFVLFLALFIRGSYLFELVITMLPYWLVLNFGLLLLISLKVFSKPQILSSPFLLVTMLFFGIVTITLLVRFVQFSYLPLSYLPKAQGYENKEVRVAFFNKLYSNTNYEDIDAALNRIQPELIGFSEMMESDIQAIPALTNYQCVLIKQARDAASLALFSTYPCEIKQDIPGTKYVLPVTLTMEGQEYHVFVIHPLPPGTPSWLKERNNELKLLSVYIKGLESDKVIVMGDFNTSPWSHAFRQFAQTTMLKNTAQGYGPSFTYNGGLIQTHVDHIYVPQTATIESFQREYVHGSDHQLIWSRLHL